MSFMLIFRLKTTCKGVNKSRRRFFPPARRAARGLHKQLISICRPAHKIRAAGIRQGTAAAHSLEIGVGLLYASLQQIPAYSLCWIVGFGAESNKARFTPSDVSDSFISFSYVSNNPPAGCRVRLRLLDCLSAAANMLFCASSGGFIANGKYFCRLL